MPMIIEDKKILQEISTTKNLTLSSIKNYECAMRQYTTYNQMSMTELIQEAELKEEELRERSAIKLVPEEYESDYKVTGTERITGKRA